MNGAPVFCTRCQPHVTEAVRSAHAEGRDKQRELAALTCEHRCDCHRDKWCLHRALADHIRKGSHGVKDRTDATPAQKDG